MDIKHIKKYGIFLLIFVVGVFLGALIWSGEDQKSAHTTKHEHTEQESKEYTCSMHPSVRQDEPGDCPICGMDLIPVKDKSQSDSDVQEFKMTETAMKLAQVRTSRVVRGNSSREIFLEGKIKADQRKVYSQVLHFAGRLEELNISYEGQRVNKGQKLGLVYSPDLIAAQRELLETAGSDYGSQEMLEAAKDKLRQWKLSGEQIQKILETGEVQENFEIRADVSGYVTNMNVNKGDYLQQGTVLFEIADLSKVWAMLDAYERDIQWLQNGQQMDLKLEAFPGESFSGVISFVDPFVDENSRVIHVRVELNNQNYKLKPGMFVTGKVNARKENEQVLKIPKTAVLWTGQRSIVYVQEMDNKHIFRMREIQTGYETGKMIEVLDGLKEGDQVVSHGTFAVDAAAQLAGKASMMNAAVSDEAGKTAELVKEGETAVQQEEMPGKIEKINVPEKFREQLTAFYRDYIRMKNSFVETNGKKVEKQAKQLQQSLDDINMNLLEHKAHIKWMEYLEIMQRELDIIAGSQNIEKQRNAFVTFNPAFYRALKAFGLSGETAYYQYCPMANNDQGAYWISERKEIRNPYYGDEMMACGENKSEITSE